MRHLGRRQVWLLSGLLLSLSTRLLMAAPAGSPFQVITERNVFALRPAPPWGTDLPPAPLPKVVPVGITTIVGLKQALLRVCMPARPPEPAKEVSCILTVGQREGPIEVLAIDEATGSIEVNNSGTIIVLSLDRDSPRQQASLMPPGPRRRSISMKAASVRSGGLAGTRTRDQRLKRPLLYRLSYQPGTAKGTAVFGRCPCGIEPAWKTPAKSKALGKLINQTGRRKGIFRRLPSNNRRVHCRRFMKSPFLLVASLAVLLAGCATSATRPK